MARPPEPIYLEKQTYRRRRLEDAARFVPWLGVVLLIFPALWSDDVGAKPPGTAGRGVYIFAVWSILVLASALLTRGLMRRDPPRDPEEDDVGT